MSTTVIITRTERVVTPAERASIGTVELLDGPAIRCDPNGRSWSPDLDPLTDGCILRERPAAGPR